MGKHPPLNPPSTVKLKLKQFGQMPWLDFVLLKNPLFLFLVNRGLINMEFAVLPFARRQIAARENRQVVVDEQKRDLLDRMLAVQEKDPELLNDVEISKVCGMLVFAGSDTTCVPLPFLSYSLVGVRGFGECSDKSQSYYTRCTVLLFASKSNCVRKASG
jgi:hypothetical protein